MLPPHSLMTFYTLAANLGAPCRSDGKGDLVDPDVGVRVIDMIRELVALIDPSCFSMDPIAVFERMSADGAEIACSPLIYGYVSYSMAGFRPRTVHFTDIAAAGNLGPAGSALGGTGIAVSGYSRAIPDAINFAYWIASGDVQRGPYAAAGGQPGHGQAWEDAAVNAATADFYRATRATLQSAWVRPRHDGYMAFQQQGSDCLNDGLRAGTDGKTIVAELNRLFRASFSD
jgi:multiple sugar transport system substrate-binding protein